MHSACIPHRTALLTLAFVGALCLVSSPTRASVRLVVDDDVAVSLGLRIQPYLRVLPDERAGRTAYDFMLRRARLRLGVEATKWVEGFAQTDVGGGEGGGGLDVRLIDAYVTFKPHPFLHLTAGQHQAPASRQTLTSSAALLAIDRPALNNKSLTWAVRGRAAFSTVTPDALASGVDPPASSRDQGATLTGGVSPGDRVHLKWALGVYDGVHAPDGHAPRVTGRLELNLFDPEPKYSHRSTWLGKKRTIAIGASYDWQAEVAATADGGTADYHYVSGDVFVDWPVGPGALTFEAGGSWLRFEGGDALDLDGDAATPVVPVDRVAGVGAYAQTGYHIAGWQPWVQWERWFADTDGGSYQLVRAGVTWYLDGHDLNLKLGYEYFLADEPILDGGADTLHTVILATFFDY